MKYLIIAMLFLSCTKEKLELKPVEEGYFYRATAGDYLVDCGGGDIIWFGQFAGDSSLSWSASDCPLKAVNVKFEFDD